MGMNLCWWGKSEQVSLFGVFFVGKDTTYLLPGSRGGSIVSPPSVVLEAFVATGGVHGVFLVGRGAVLPFVVPSERGGGGTGEAGRERERGR